MNFPLLLYGGLAPLIWIGLFKLWYAPWFLGRLWAEQFGLERRDMRVDGQLWLIALLMGIINALTFLGLSSALGFTALGQFMFLAGIIWLAFALPTATQMVIVPQGTLVQYMIDVGYLLAGYLMLGLWAWTYRTMF